MNKIRDKMQQDGPEMRKMQARTTPEMAPRVPKMAPRGLKMAPRGPQESPR